MMHLAGVQLETTHLASFWCEHPHRLTVAEGNARSSAHVRSTKSRGTSTGSGWSGNVRTCRWSRSRSRAMPPAGVSEGRGPTPLHCRLVRRVAVYTLTDHHVMTAQSCPTMACTIAVLSSVDASSRAPVLLIR